MSVPKFDEKELGVVRELPLRTGGTIPVYGTPVPLGEGYLALQARQPIWQVTNCETLSFTPSINKDNIARAFVFEGQAYPREKYGGPDMFGLEWVFVEVTGGSIVRPGSPLLASTNEWKDKIQFPDVEKWDWAASKALNVDYLKDDRTLLMTFLNGYFERLIAFMDFDKAAVALIDEDQQDAVKAFFQALSDLYIKIFDKFIDTYNVKVINLHDDWGTQINPFFSPDTCEEMIVPYMRQVTDHLRSRGVVPELHCCGKVERQVPNMIKAGFNSWGGMYMNDYDALYDAYGDKFIFGVLAPEVPATASLEEQRDAARAFVKRYCSDPKRPVLYNNYRAANLTPAYREELYKQSRIAFGG